MMRLDAVIGGRQLRVRHVSACDEIDVRGHRAGTGRLVVIAEIEMLHGDPLAHYGLARALGTASMLFGVRASSLPSFALDIALPAQVAGSCHESDDLTVVCVGIPADLVAAAVLIACGLPIARALAWVTEQRHEEPPSRDEEIALSVAAEHINELQIRERRRFKCVAAGGSPWEVE